jgi:hypothetical protein
VPRDVILFKVGEMENAVRDAEASSPAKRGRMERGTRPKLSQRRLGVLFVSRLTVWNMRGTAGPDFYGNA